MNAADARPRAPVRRLVLGAATTLAVALPVALWHTEAHVVPSALGLWRGVSDAPGPGRVALALLCGVLVAWAARRATPAVLRPLWALALAGAPLVPLVTGTGLVLLGFERPALALVLAGAVSVAAVRAWSQRFRLAPGDWRRDLALLAAGFVFFAWLGRHLPGPAGPQGDEPHYLLMTHSLLHDGDVDLADEFARAEYRAFFRGTLRAHTSPASPRGVIYPVHAPGLAALLLPAYALGGYAGVKLFLAFVAALAAALAQRLVRQVTGSGLLGAASWATLVAVPPLPLYAQAVYPETPAALATIVFLLCARGHTTRGKLLAAGLAAAALPWLHPKFLPLSAVGLGLALLRPSPSGASSWRTRGARLAAALLFLLAVAGLLLFFQALYGQASLSAAYGPRIASDVSLARVPRGLLALFLDRQFGLFLLAPVWALALPACAALWRERPGDTLRALLLAGATLGVGASFSMWWGGACPPGRFVVPALPALALALALAFRQRRDAAVALLAAGLAVTLLAAEAPYALHNRADGQSGLLRFLTPSLDVDASLPSFVVGGGGAPLLALSLLAVLALGWARTWRGLAVGLVAYALLSGSMREGSLVDARTATARLVNSWDDTRMVSLSGPLDPSLLTLPLDLPRAPWTLRTGERRRTRRVAVPPGLYRLEVDAHPGAKQEAVHLTRLEAATDDLSLDWVHLRIDRPVPSMTLLLPGGAPRLVLVAAGVADEAVVSGARLVPLALVPRRLRETFRFPAAPLDDRYRVGDETLRVTVVDRSEPEGEGYRLDGEWGQLTLETPPGSHVVVHVRRERPDADDRLWWNGREIALPARMEVALTLDGDEGVRLGDTLLSSLVLRAEGAWIGVTGAS